MRGQQKRTLQKQTMDLQSILDASDSSDDANVNDTAYKYYPSEKTLSSSPPNNHDTSAVDIEKILRESYDEDDEDDDWDENYRRSAITADDILAGDRYDINDVPIITTPSSLKPHGSSDWDILQAILSSDDEDDEVDDDGDWINQSHVRNQSLATATGILDNGSLDVEDDDDDDGDQHVLERTRDESTLLSSLKIPPRVSGESSTANGASLFQTNGGSASAGSPMRISFYDPVQMKDVDARKLKIMEELAEDQKGEEISHRALSYAHSQEQKLLKSGHRDMVSPLRVKRRLKQKIELTARGQESTSSSSTTQNRISSLSVTRFGSSGIVENKTMEKISGSIEKHSDRAAKVMCGLPTCLAFNSKFIAVGTQLGIILVYDLFEVLRQRLGATYDDNNLTAAQRAGSITSLDICLNGEAIAAGYSSGMVVLWDTIRGIVLRAVSDSHQSPISSVRFLNELKVVTVDVGGLVNKMTFAKNMLWANYSMEPECLLDGTAGQILAMNVLAPFSTVKKQLRPKSLTPFLRKLTLLALSSERSSFAVAVEPQISVLHRWAKPPTEKTRMLNPPEDLLVGENYLPCLSWGWGMLAGGGNKVMPILARGWGCCLQLLVASFPTVESGEDAVDPNGETSIHWPAFGIHKEIDTEKPIVALEWLDDRSLMYLTLTNEFTLVDTVMMTLLERLDFSGLRLVYAEFALSRNAKSPDTGDNEEGSLPLTTFQNSIRYSDDRLMVLCQSELKCISIVGARRRVSSLEEDGEWLEALALALDHYESTVISQEDRRRDQSGKKDLSRHPDIFRAKNDEEEWLAKLLIRYLNLAVENAPETASPSRFSKNSASNGGNELARSHFQMLAGVCIEFCVVTRKADLLFGPIFERFQSVGYTSIFLDVLEPYVLNDKLPYIGAEAMSFFVEHCKATNDIATVERCLLHMDCSIMDFDTILSLLRRNKMFTALFYVYNNGLDDYVSPLEIILEEVFDKADVGSTSINRRSDGVLQNEFERLGYKALLYLRSCFTGKTFPLEQEIKPDDRRFAVKKELLIFLMQEKYSSSCSISRRGNRASSSGHRSLPYPYLRILLLVDSRCTLETISIYLDSPEIHLLATGSVDEWGQDEHERNFAHASSLQGFVQILADIIRPKVSTPGMSGMSKFSLNAFLDFASKYIMNGSVTVDRGMTHLLFDRLSNVFTAAENSNARRKAQKRVMDVLSALPRESYDPDKVLQVINNAGMHRAALLLHQQVASSWSDGFDDIELRSKHFQSAIDCYIGDEDLRFRAEVYAYIKKECAGVANMDSSPTSRHPKTLRDSLYSKLPALCRLDPLMTASLVADLFVDDLDLVIESLESSAEDQFRFLHAIASGTLGHLDPVAGSVLILQTEHYHTYLALMAKLHPEMVYDYLSTHDNYRTQECLALCEEYDIPDATVYLLERTDKVNDALRLGLQTLESRMMELKRSIRGMGIDSFHQKHCRGSKSSEDSNQPNKQELALSNLKRMLTVVLDVCERKSLAHGSKLWFTVLDRLITAKGILRLSKEQPQHAKIMSDVLSNLLRLTMQRMVSSVPLTDLVQKVTTDNSGSSLGELREMLNSLLGTYAFELNVFQGASAAFQEDIHKMRAQYRQLCIEGSPVRTVMSRSLVDVSAPVMVSMARQQTLLGSTLQVGANGNASLFQREQIPYTKRVESGLATTLSRVRARRNDRERRSRDSGRNSSLNMMTTTDIMFQNNEVEPVLLGHRQVGALGPAEHYGRLVMF